MEEMKWDMGGAGAVFGAMEALAASGDFAAPRLIDIEHSAAIALASATRRAVGGDGAEDERGGHDRERDLLRGFRADVEPDGSEDVRWKRAGRDAGPYRNTRIEPAELGRMFVEDALAIVATVVVSSSSWTRGFVSVT